MCVCSYLSKVNFSDSDCHKSRDDCRGYSFKELSERNNKYDSLICKVYTPDGTTHIVSFDGS